MLIDYELTCCRLRSSNCILVRVISQVLKEPETFEDPSSDEPDTMDAETDAEVFALG